ncbi:MAG: CDGSH iron-sulfur domain-containing protein [Cyclobacteriaceae bacterium]|nr:CDGSH iron-sulfur domain-containing protein [Cyclobacteriaceae bacterium]MCH8516352.1 CDGSH iron-sulfur domain-containing protein [Cyclobacteriaceae bacterium]
MEKPKIAQLKPILETVAPGTYYWCACGLSKNQPYCDGSHKGTNFVPTQVEIEKERKVLWCACKYSEKNPFCDGAHSRLPRE